MQLDFRFHHAGSDRTASIAHVKGMADAYESVGYGALVPDVDELIGQDVHLLTGWEDGVPVAGLRFHRRADGPLPTEVAFDSLLVNSILRVFDDLSLSVGEAAGTWVASSHRGTLASHALVSTAVSACLALDVDVCVGSSPTELIPLYEAAGAAYIKDQPFADTPLPGVTGYFFYRRLPVGESLVYEWEAPAVDGAEEFRSGGQMSSQTLDLLMRGFLQQPASVGERAMVRQ